MVVTLTYNNLRKVYLGLDNEGRHWEVVIGGQLYVFKCELQRMFYVMYLI